MFLEENFEWRCKQLWKWLIKILCSVWGAVQNKFNFTELFAGPRDISVLFRFSTYVDVFQTQQNSLIIKSSPVNPSSLPLFIIMFIWHSYISFILPFIAGWQVWSSKFQCTKNIYIIYNRLYYNWQLQYTRKMRTHTYITACTMTIAVLLHAASSIGS